MMVLNIFIECVPDKTLEIFEFYKQFSDGIIKIKGLTFFKAYKNGNEIVLIEKWKDENHFKEFIATEQFKSINKFLDGKTKSLLVEKYKAELDIVE